MVDANSTCSGVSNKLLQPQASWSMVYCIQDICKCLLNVLFSVVCNLQIVLYIQPVQSHFRMTILFSTQLAFFFFCDLFLTNVVHFCACLLLFLFLVFVIKLLICIKMMHVKQLAGATAKHASPTFKHHGLNIQIFYVAFDHQTCNKPSYMIHNFIY